MDRREFAQFSVDTSVIHRPESSIHSHSYPGHLQCGFLQCIVQGAALKKLQLVPNGVTTHLCSIHWLSFWFLMKFKGWVLTFKTLSGMGPSYFRNTFSQSYLPIPLGPEGGVCCRCHLLKRSIWWDQDNISFLLWFSPSGTSFPLVASSLLAFWKAPITWFYQQHWAFYRESTQWLHCI